MVSAPACGLSGAAYQLSPTFFGAAEAADGLLEIRVQRGSDLENFSDGLTVLVLDPAGVQASQLNMPIPVLSRFDAPVRMSIYLNETCPVVRPEQPVNYEAVSGEITFSDIYAPRVGGDRVETAARFVDVLFEDRRAPTERFARLSGDFRFLFSRGRPAQLFP